MFDSALEIFAREQNVGVFVFLRNSLKHDLLDANEPVIAWIVIAGSG
jgi:hypothetical protein